MAMPSESSIFESLLQSALEEYKKETNIDLVKHPLADQIERCDSVEAITQAVQGQAQAFRDFRGGNNKLITSLKNAVQVLYTISSSTVDLGHAIGLVSLICSWFLHSLIFDTIYSRPHS
jgi:hypothetical protein